MIKNIVLVCLIFSASLAIAAPPISFDTSRKNSFGGNDYYKSGRMVYKSTGNIWHSENIYSKKGLDYKGFKSTMGTERWNKSRNYAR